MSQRAEAQKGFAVGRGLLAAAETLNFSSGRQLGGGASGGGGEGLDGPQMPRRGGGHLGSTMKLFASLGLSPSDLDALAQIPEDDISVETLPHILMQLKSRKGDAGERRAPVSERHRGLGRDSWDDTRAGGAPLGQSSAADFGFGPLRDAPPSRGFGMDYGRERFPELNRDTFGLGVGAQDPVFMQRRISSPSHGKVQDFLGVLPPVFPHVCSLCDFDVHSAMVSTPLLQSGPPTELRLLVSAAVPR